MLTVVNPFMTETGNIPTVAQLKPGDLFEIAGRVNMVVENVDFLMTAEYNKRAKDRAGDFPGTVFAVELNSGRFGLFYGLTPCNPVDAVLTVIDQVGQPPDNGDAESSND